MNLIMTEHEQLNAKIRSQESIVLSKGSELFRPIVYCISTICILFFLFILFFFKVFIFSLVTFVFISSIIYLLVKTQRKYVKATIKGEMLLIKDEKNINRITPVTSIKSISTFTFFSINLTKIVYKLDGRNHKICLLKKLDSEEIENEEIIKVAMKVA